MKRSWRGWVRDVASELDRLGHVAAADRLSECGRFSTVRSCEDCGEGHASAELRTSCDVRVCPWCARRLARERTQRLTAGLVRVSGYVAARAPGAVAELEALAVERARVAAVHAERAAAARERYETSTGTAATRAAELYATHAERAERAEAAARDARFDAARAREAQRGRWSWKLITVSPRWNPLDENAYTVAGLREREASAWAAWERVRERYAVGGLAAAVASLEVSEAGHVHVHALVYGPWIVAEYAATLAGCHVDVRAVAAVHAARRAHGNDWLSAGARARTSTDDALRSAITEAVKYVAKSPSVLSSQWVSGGARRTMQPILAARIVVAFAGRKTGRVYGPARDAIAAAALDNRSGAQDATPPVEHCRCCGSLALAAPRREPTETVARVLGLAWGPTLALRRLQRARGEPASTT